MATQIADEIAGVRTWRLSSLPRELEPDQVEAVLASCDRGTVTHAVMRGPYWTGALMPFGNAAVVTVPQAAERQR